MKAGSWVIGIIGIVIALFGIIGGFRGPVVMLMGREHAPSTLISLGVLVLVVGVWLGVLHLMPKK
jgi:multisubunit Na+/H+ antiporter MnhG subunit